MRLRAPTLAAALLLGAALATSRAAAAPAMSFTPCPDQPGLGCSTLDVPLDRSGAVPGTVTLAIRRRMAGAAPTSDAVVGLAGGPGQAALPLFDVFQKVMAPALPTRDLIVFDQRGTGSSDPLQCPALSSGGSVGSVVQDCANELGPARASFTTADSVADLEAIRQAAGYDKLVLFGVSYGTKVALEYAERYPQHVERLVLDSVVDVNSPDPLQRATFAAVPRVLNDLCSNGACRSITANPTADIAALVARMRRAPLTGRVFDGAGRRHAISLGRGDLLDILVAGDENPALRALLPAAVHSALHGDPAPLLRLALLAAGLTPDSVATSPPNTPTATSLQRALSRRPATRQATPGAFDPALYLNTTCEEGNFPWTPRNAPLQDRVAQATRQALSLPAAAVYPFDQLTALLSGPIATCLRWPVASPPPPAPAPVPAVPALVLSGAADLRTPTEDAQRVASEIPAAQLFVAAHTGHSVLGTDLSGCAAGAVSAFFAGVAPAPCNPRPNVFLPTPVPPTLLSSVHAVSGLRGRAGQTLAAVQLALVDLRRQIVGAAIELGRALPTGARFGGLRGGRAVVISGGVRLYSLTYVPGMSLSGPVPVSVLVSGGGGTAHLVIAGSAAAHGTVQLSGGRASGVLDGHRFHVALAVAARAAGQWPTSLPFPQLARAG